MMRLKSFIPNEDDNLHCLQSCFAMINNTILDEKVTLKEAEVLTNFKEGLPTWPFKAMLSFAEKGLSVVNIENFPIGLFLHDPIAAIRQQFHDEEVANKIISVSNFDEELIILKKCIDSGRVNFDERIPNIEDIRSLISNHYFIICNINYWLLIEQSDKYDGHFIVIEEVDDNYLIIQNPGLPPIANQRVSIDNFIKAWCYPNEHAANIIAIHSQR